MLHMRVKVHSPTPPGRPVRDVSLSQLAPRIHQFANCHRAHSKHTSLVRRGLLW